MCTTTDIDVVTTDRVVSRPPSVRAEYFSGGLSHGAGTLTSSNGSSFSGTWSRGQRMEGTETLPNNDVFKGVFYNEAREGQGSSRRSRGGW